MWVGIDRCLVYQGSDYLEIDISGLQEVSS